MEYDYERILTEGTDIYNKSCFSDNLRGKLHYARFRWLQRSLARLDCTPKKVLELGCYDAKTIHYLPIPPRRYLGLDINKPALRQAREFWKNDNYTFLFSRSPDQIPSVEQFDISVCMETFEYLSSDLLPVYVERLSRATREYIFATAPNQKGLVFASKHLTKSLLGLQKAKLSASEIFNSCIGRLGKIERRDRIGFDYNLLVENIRQHFRIIEVSSYPFRSFPLYLSFGICIIGSKRNH